MSIIPGNWYVHDPGAYKAMLVRSDEGGIEYMVAKVWSDGEGDYETTARLIAAAPELFHACRLFVALEDSCAHDSDTRWKEARNAMRDAIRKAEERFPIEAPRS